MASPVSASHTRSQISSNMQSVANSDSSCLWFPRFRGATGLSSVSETVVIVSDSTHDVSSSVSADDSAASAGRILRCGRCGCASGSDGIGVLNMLSIRPCKLQRGLVHVFVVVRFPHRLIEWRSTAITSELRSDLDMLVCRLLESKRSTACSCVACICLLASERYSTCEGVACSRRLDRLVELCCY
jgi:hypothetical protein